MGSEVCGNSYFVFTVSDGEIGGTVSANESEIIFIGTGTSEGIPRVSCLTDPIKKCPVRISNF